MIENRTSVGKSAEDFIRLQDLWGMFFQKWYWFALSLFVALATASLYLLSTPNVYTRTAAILVKDDSKNNSSASAMNEFADMGIFKSNTNINNELLTLKSPTLMTEVVKRLGLNEIYTVRRGLKRIELYKSSPILVTYLFDDKKSVSFDIEVGAQKQVLSFKLYCCRRRNRGTVRRDYRRFHSNISRNIGHQLNFSI